MSLYAMDLAATLRRGSGGVYERPTEADLKEAAEEAAEGAHDYEGFGGGGCAPKDSIEATRLKTRTTTKPFRCVGTLNEHLVRSWGDAPQDETNAHDVLASVGAPAVCVTKEVKVESLTPLSCDVYCCTRWLKCGACHDADKAFATWATVAAKKRKIGPTHRGESSHDSSICPAARPAKQGRGSGEEQTGGRSKTVVPSPKKKPTDADDEVAVRGGEDGKVDAEDASTLLDDPSNPANCKGKSVDSQIQVEVYSAKSIVVRGKGTYAVKGKLKGLGGRWNRHLQGGGGWIFPKTIQPRLVAMLEEIDQP